MNRRAFSRLQLKVMQSPYVYAAYNIYSQQNSTKVLYISILRDIYAVYRNVCVCVSGVFVYYVFLLVITA